MSWVRKVMPLLLAGGLLGTTSLASAEQIVKPHTFSAGTPANAEQVNADFDMVYGQVNKVGAAISVQDQIQVDTVGSAILVDGGGNVGIGTAVPAGELHVTKPLRMTDVRFTGGAGGNNLTVDASGYSSTGVNSYVVQVINGDPAVDLIRYSSDGEETWSAPVEMSATGVTIADNVVLRFAQVDGHATWDRWDFAIYPGFADGLIVRNGKVTVKDLAIPTGAAAGEVLTSDATGNASWQAAPASSYASRAGEADNALALNGQAASAFATAAELSSHTSATNNPHAVTASQTGAAALSGNIGPVALGTTDNTAFTVNVNNSQAFKIVPHMSSPNIIGGRAENQVTTGVKGAVISGGGLSYRPNLVTDDFGVIGGGDNNVAGNNLAPTTDRAYATVSGGASNTASGQASTVGGGMGNTASGYVATVPGGSMNTASGIGSFAAGGNAKALHDYTFVWGGGSGDFSSTGASQFLLNVPGGVGINKNNPATALDVSGTITASGYAGNGSGLANVNAETLAGQAATAFAAAAHTHSGGEITSAVANANYAATAANAATATNASYAVNATNANNAHTVDNLHAGNASGNVPVSNGALNSNLNAERVGGLSATDLAQKATTYTKAEVDALLQAQSAQILANIRFSGKAWGTATLVEYIAPTASGPPAIAADGAGNFMAVWSQHDGTTYSLWANRYVAATDSWGGTPVVIENDNSGRADSPQVAMDAGGNAIAVWQQSDGVRTNIMANRYDAATGLWGATAQLLETDNAGDAQYPQVAVDGNGNAMAVWEQFDGAHLNIRGNRYDVATKSWGAAQRIDTNAAGDADYTQVVMLGNGNALAIWEQFDGTIYHVWACRYTVANGSWDAPRAVETEANHAIAPRIVKDGGNAAAIWMQGSVEIWNIMANRYDAATDSWGTPQLVETDNTNSAYTPQLAMDSSGNGLAVWEQSDGTRDNIWANKYTSGVWGTAQLIESDNSGGAFDPLIVMDNSGNAIVVWYQSDGIRYNAWANKYALGTWGIPQLIETNNAGPASDTRLAMDGNGNVMAVWRQDNGSKYDIWANRYR